MKILFISHYFPPEVNAPANRTYEHCAQWVRDGHEVTVITCVPNCPHGEPYEGYRSSFRTAEETVDGLRVLRVWSYLTPNRGVRRRTLNYLSFMLSAFLASLRVEKPDVVVATSPQFFCGWAGVLVHWFRRVPFVLEIRDIWPESIKAVGAMRNRWLLALLAKLEVKMYRAADQIVAVGEGYRDNIVEKIGEATPVAVVTNGVDLEHFSDVGPDARFLHKMDLEDRFVCSYVGTIGMAHGLDVVVRASKLLREQGRRDIAFCLVGDGADRERLERMTQEHGLEDYVKFAGRLPHDEIPHVLASSNALLVHLRDCDLFSSVIPSKVFESMAIARPIVMGVRGEAREIVRKAGAALEMEPEDSRMLVQNLIDLRDNRQLYSRLAAAGRRYVERHYNRSMLASRMLAIVCRTAGVNQTDRGQIRELELLPQGSPAEKVQSLRLPERELHGAVMGNREQ